MNDRRQDAKLQVAGCSVLQLTQQRLHEASDLVRDVVDMLSAWRVSAASGP